MTANSDFKILSLIPVITAPVPVQAAVDLFPITIEARSAPAAPLQESHVVSIEIGAGTSGRVFRDVHPRTGSPVAIKEDHPGESYYSSVKDEGCFLHELARNGTPHRLQFRAWSEHVPGQLRIMTDFIPEKNIHDYRCRFGRLTNDDFRIIFLQSLEYLVSLQAQGIIHGDLKPQNMIYELLCRYLTIVDQGMSQKVGRPILELIQTSFYRAPEVILKGPVDCSADIWSLGCIMYELWTGATLFLVYDHPTDLTMSSRQLLGKIAYQLGFPSTGFLEKCQDDYPVILPEDLQTQKPWQAAMREAGVNRAVFQREVEQLIQLMEKILTYENRASPQELLNSPFFQKDVRFHLSSDFLPTDKIDIFHTLDIEAEEEFGFPVEPVLSIDMDMHVTRTCLHMPAAPEGRYTVQIERQGSFWTSAAYLDGETFRVEQNNSENALG